MNIEFEKFVKNVDDVIADMRSSFQFRIENKEIPLDERWELYCKLSEKLLEEGDMRIVDNFEEIKRVGLDFEYEEVYGFRDRYEYISLVDLVDNVRYAIENLNYYKRSSQIEQLQQLDVNALKEEIMACGCSGFTVDW